MRYILKFIWVLVLKTTYALVLMLLFVGMLYTLHVTSGY